MEPCTIHILTAYTGHGKEGSACNSPWIFPLIRHGSHSIIPVDSLHTCLSRRRRPRRCQHLRFWRGLQMFSCQHLSIGLGLLLVVQSLRNRKFGSTNQRHMSQGYRRISFRFLILCLSPTSLGSSILIRSVVRVTARRVGGLLVMIGRVIVGSAEDCSNCKCCPIPLSFVFTFVLAGSRPVAPKLVRLFMQMYWPLLAFFSLCWFSFCIEGRPSTSFHPTFAGRATVAER